ncbi:MAG: hypothetical protein HFG20_01200 [Anaerotruncus sp.]|nr:hypothetical protein [Anaerotruncus sp.]
MKVFASLTINRRAAHKSFRQPFTKGCGFQRQRLWSCAAAHETLFPEKRIFGVNCGLRSKPQEGAFCKKKSPLRKSAAAAKNRQRFFAASLEHRSCALVRHLPTEKGRAVFCCDIPPAYRLNR